LLARGGLAVVAIAEQPVGRRLLRAPSALRAPIMSEHDTVIVGAGIAGICAGYALADRGLPALVLERNECSIGGRVAAYPSTSFEHQGREYVASLEHGVHGWWRQYRNFLALLEHAGLRDRLVDAYDQAILFDDGQQMHRTNVGRQTQVTPWPEPVHHTPLLWKRNIRRLMSVRDLPRIATMAGKVMESLFFDPYLEAHRERYDRLPVSAFTRDLPFFFQSFLKSLTRSGFFSDPPEVSLWAFLLALQLYVFLRKEDQCFSFARGAVAPTVLEPLAERIRQKGGAVVKGIRVERLVRRPEGGWRLEFRRTGAAEPDAPAELQAPAGSLAAKALVLAVDVEGAKELGRSCPALADALGDADVFVGQAATAIRLWWSRSPSSRWGESGVFGGKATADNYFWLHRFVDEFAAWHAETGGAVSECHIYAPQSLHALSDEELFSRVERDMARAFPEVAGCRIHRAIVRNRATHINFPVGCARAFPQVATPFDDLVLCGDWIDGSVPVLYMERACQTALKAANLLLARRGRPPWPMRTPRRPPPHMRLVQAALRHVDRRLPQLWLTGRSCRRRR